MHLCFICLSSGPGNRERRAKIGRTLNAVQLSAPHERFLPTMWCDHRHGLKLRNLGTSPKSMLAKWISCRNNVMKGASARSGTGQVWVLTQKSHNLHPQDLHPGFMPQRGAIYLVFKSNCIRVTEKGAAADTSNLPGLKTLFNRKMQIWYFEPQSSAQKLKK